MEENSDRYKKLGFHPQKENPYNTLLPYADKLDEESADLYKNIKTNLVKSVLAREMRPGFALWTSRLNKYIKIYGLKFSKEDHITFIRLFYNVMTIQDLEPTRINKCALMLNLLLKKKYLISREDLQLDWKPLYTLCVHVMEKSKTELGMFKYAASLESTIMQVIRQARSYFPAADTQDILDEFKPKLSPLNMSDISEALEYLEVLLPVYVNPDEANISYNLWFKEFMELWNLCNSSNGWENSMMWLMAKLSSMTIGYIDWEPYIPIMFARISRVFQLPVSYRQKQSTKSYKMDIQAMSLWVVSVLSTKSESAFVQLETLMQTFKTYLYSANSGRWTFRLMEFLSKLSYYFVQRIYTERYKTKSWEPQVPEDYKLTDKDIDKFVLIMRPCVEQAMFSRRQGNNITLTLQHLASLNPKLILPMTVEKLFSSLDSLTEPHKLTSALMAVIAVGKYVVQGAQYGYPEGPTHIIPLLQALLPGIDPNDVRKCFMTFNFIMHFISMIPIVNCSEANNFYDDLTEEEHILCEATAAFEDFVIQFFDRICSWVESCSLDFIHPEQGSTSSNSRNIMESLAESALINVITVVLRQCSPNIYNAALKKIFNYVTNNVLEIRVSGKMVAIICASFVRVNPKESLKLFIPHICDRIETLLAEHSNAQKEEHLDEELLYNLQILAEIVDGRSEIVNYIDRIIKIFDKTLHMSSVEASQIAAHMLEVIMGTLTTIQPVEHKSSNRSYDEHIKDFLPIREWAAVGRVKDLTMEWYVPKDKEIAYVQSLLNKYLVPEINKLDQYSAGKIILSREELRRSLKIVIAVMTAHTMLPMWNEPALQLIESALNPWAFNLIVSGSHEITMPDGRNVRKVVADTMHRVQAKILEIDEGDTKSFENIIYIYNVLLFNKIKGMDFEQHWTNFHIIKKLQESRLLQRKLHLRHVLIDRAALQQIFRTESRSCSFTQTHKQILLDLFELSVSRYSEVRVTAQSKMLSLVYNFPYTYTILVPRIKEILQIDSEVHHEKFKGCLYILLGSKGTPIVAKHDWNFIKEIWPLLVKSKPSEKISIVNLISNICDCVSRSFPTIAIEFDIPDTIIKTAKELAENNPQCDYSDFNSVCTNSREYLRKQCEKRRQHYNATITALLDSCVSGNLHWRYHQMAVGFLKDLVHPNIPYPPEVINFFFKSLISDSIHIRKIALKVSVFILIQNKPKFKKLTIDPYSFSKTVAPNKALVLGIRDDNKWLLYNSKTIPKTADEWDKSRYLHDQSIGHYAWPKKLEIYAPSYEQPRFSKKTMTPEVQEIYSFFSSEENIKILMKYLSMEDKKGKDQFNAGRYFVFKNLFKLMEDEVLNLFLPHLQELVADKQEASQRCAAELISGLIRGSKHWPFEKVQTMWSELIPIIHTASINMLSETSSDWSICLAMALNSRDPNRHHWLLEYLMEDPLADPTSFIACGRMNLLVNAINQQTWRNYELFVRLLDYLKQYLTHPFQNIREKISSALKVILTKDIQFSGQSEMQCPKVKDFYDEYKPILNTLYSDVLKKVVYESVKKKDNEMDVENTCDTLQLITLNSEQDREKAMRLFKIFAKNVTSTVVCRGTLNIPLEFYNLLPLAAVLQSNDVDDELGPLCSNLLALLAQSLVTERHIPHILSVFHSMADCPMWSARLVLTDFLNCFVFHNRPLIISQKDWVGDIQNIVLNLLEDLKPEVRTGASKVLSGLIHCQFIPAPMDLLNHFKQKAKTKMKNKCSNETNLRIRHAGVLGLCAFISSDPYDVPEYLPDIFQHLGPHLSDPQPIPGSIRKTLGDFKRTHHDNWEMHKLKFTDSELSVLNDLTVPPSYYA